MAHSDSNQVKILKYSSPWKAIMRICLPTVILTLAQSIYNVIDKFLLLAFASNDVLNNFHDAARILDPTNPLVGAGELINLATQYGGNVYMFIFTFCGFSATGSAVYFSINYGANDKRRVQQAVGNGFCLTMTSAIVLGIVAWLLTDPHFGSPIISIQDDVGGRGPVVVTALNQLSFNYVVLMCACAPILALEYLFISFFRNEGRTFMILGLTLLSICVNVLFAFVFVKEAHLMMLGGMLATVVALSITVIVCLCVAFFSKTTQVKFTKMGFKIEMKVIVFIAFLGLSDFIWTFSMVFVSFLETNLTGNLIGNTVFPNNQTVSLQQLYSAISPWLFLMMGAAIGIMDGGIALMGYAYGACLYKRCKALAVRIFFLQLIWFAFVMVILLTCGQYMIGLFDDFHGNHRWLLVLNFSTSIFEAVPFTFVALLMGMDRGIQASSVVLTRSFLVPVPMIFIAYGVAQACVNPLLFFLIYGLSEFVSACIIAVTFYLRFRSYKHCWQDIDLNDHPEAFNTFNELIAIKHLNQINRHLHSLHLSERAKNKLDASMTKWMGLQEKYRMNKKNFIARSVDEPQE